MILKVKGILFINFFIILICLINVDLSPSYSKPILKTQSQLHYKKHIQAQYIMGTIFKIEIYTESESFSDNKVKDIFSKAFNEIRKCDVILSDYRKDSELSKILEEAHSHPVYVSDPFFYVTARSLYFSEITKGKFDITIRPLISLWGFKNKDFKIPSLKEIESVKNSIGYKNILLDEKNKTIFIRNPKTKLDFGAIGKGYAIDKAVEVLKDSGIKTAFIDSVSNQYYLGSPPNKKFWTVGIKDPRNTEKVIKYLNLKNKAVSTSGDYEQFFIKDKIRYSHIIDPLTGYPVKYLVSATIVSDNGADADALSTSVLLLNDKDRERLLKLFPNSYLANLSKSDI